MERHYTYQILSHKIVLKFDLFGFDYYRLLWKWISPLGYPRIEILWWYGS